MKKKLLALVCALALTVSLVGCALSTPDTVGKIGDFEVTSGLYLLAQYDAYQQAAQLADSEQDTSKVNSFLKATITTDADTGETAVVKDYVAQKTLETLQTLAAVDARFAELGGELTEEQKSAADSYAQQLMDNYAVPAAAVQAGPAAGSCLRQGRRDPCGGRRADRASGQHHVRDRFYHRAPVQHQHLRLCQR